MCQPGGLVSETCGSRSCASSAKPASDCSEMAVAGPWAQGLAHRAPGTLCSQLNTAQAAPAPGQPEGFLGAGVVPSLSHGCVWQAPQAAASRPTPEPPYWGGYLQSRNYSE